jgi:hypothetical protein
MFYLYLSEFCENEANLGVMAPTPSGAAKRISDPPDPKEKTAGRAPTLPSGNFDSCAAIPLVYDNAESCARQKNAGGAQ